MLQLSFDGENVSCCCMRGRRNCIFSQIWSLFIMKLASLHVLARSVSDVNFDIHSDSHPTIGMETSSSSSGLTNTETGTDTNEQVSLCFNNQGTDYCRMCK